MNERARAGPAAELQNFHVRAQILARNLQLLLVGGFIGDRAFLVTAEEGSLSAAAHALGLTQPTLGRQVSALETELGVTLFERVGRSLELTQSGHELLDHVRMMGEAASHISLTASGQSQTIEGQVCITAADMVSAYLLTPAPKQLRAAAPGIEIEVIAFDSISDLHRREADIAIRYVRPDQPDLIAKLLRETSGHLYASSSYLDRIGRPTTLGELANADFIGLGNNDRLISVLNGLGLSLTRDNFGVSTASGIFA